MIDLGGGSQPPQRHPKEPHPIPALPFNVALLKGASLVGVDSAQIRRQEPEVYARLTNDIASWLGNGRAPAPRASTLVWGSRRSTMPCRSLAPQSSPLVSIPGRIHCTWLASMQELSAPRKGRIQKRKTSRCRSADSACNARPQAVV